MRLSQITTRTARARINIDGEDLTVTVQPYLMTPERERLMASADNADEQVDGLIQFFCEYVTEWDLTDDNEQPIPLKPDVVGETLPSSLLLWIMAEAKRATDPLARTSQRNNRR